MLSAPESPIWLSLWLKYIEQNVTPEISSEVSEVFDWSAREMLSAPEFPIRLPVVR